MIDFELDVFNTVRDRVVTLCSANRVLSTPIDSYAALPAISLYEMSNTVDRGRQSSTPVENYANITYQLEVVATTKSECRSVFNAADEAMIAMNFTRISGQYVPALSNKAVLRYIARYEAKADTEGNLYRA